MSIVASAIPIAQDRSVIALRLLSRLHEAAVAKERRGRAIKIKALMALAHWVKDERSPALAALKDALTLAEPEGYVRTFADEGTPMADLLRHALSQGVRPNYAARLVAAMDLENRRPSVPGMASLPEPPSEREQDVLRLVVAGLSNAQIAEELFVAVSTVKSHINHIYAKLGVKNRVEAVTQARARRLL